jgi:hypothetical protein
MAKGTTPYGEQDAAKDADAKEVVAVLLDLLRRAGRDVRLTPELEGKALEAVERYRKISLDLAVRKFFG